MMIVDSWRLMCCYMIFLSIRAIENEYDMTTVCRFPTGDDSPLITTELINRSDTYFVIYGRDMGNGIWVMVYG